MKHILLTLLLTLGLSASITHKATVLEAINSAGYTYIKVKEGTKTYWIAMMQRTVKVGDKISFVEEAQMRKFHSKTLNRTFETILFASDTTAQKASTVNMKNANNIMTSEYKEKGTISIAELLSNKDSYVAKEITIKGLVIKVSESIMKRNWVHLDDGSRFGNIDSIVFTSEGKVPSTGSVVYAKGTVEKDVDFGFGYFYPVIVDRKSVV